MGMRRVLARNLRAQRVGESPTDGIEGQIGILHRHPAPGRIAQFAKLVKISTSAFQAALPSTGGGGRIAAPSG